MPATPTAWTPDLWMFAGLLALGAAMFCLYHAGAYRAERRKRDRLAALRPADPEDIWGP